MMLPLPLLRRSHLPAWGLVLAVATGAPAVAYAQNPVARPDQSVAMTGEGVPILAFVAEDGHDHPHVWVTGPDGRSRELAPPGPGADSAPTLTSVADGRHLVAVSRRDRDRVRLWTRMGGTPDWDSPVWLDSGLEDVHPALATGGGRTWLAWVGLGADGDSRLFAAEWRRNRWVVEVVTSGHRSVARPAIAVGPDGLPRVVWAALDGADSEIWLARRGNRRWKPVQRVTTNRRHDLAPTIEFEGATPTVAWETLEGGTYRPYAVELRGPRHLPRGAPVSLDNLGAAVQLADTGEGLAAMWARPDAADPSRTELVSARRTGRSWSAPEVLARSRNARAAVAAGRNGSWSLGWHQDIGLAAARVRPFGAGSSLEPLHGSPGDVGAAIEISLPGSYLALGDSISAGLVRYDGVISFVDGYSVHLGQLISESIGQNVLVDQRAVPGELSSEGLNRLRSILSSDPRKVVFLNEGANDVANLVTGEVVRDNLIAMAHAVQGVGGLPLVGTVTPRTEGGFTGGINDRIIYANELIREAIPKVALLVDLWAAFIGRADLYSDHIHPDAEGYRYMAGVWFRVLLPVLNDLLRNDDTERSVDEELLLRTRVQPPDRHQ